MAFDSPATTQHTDQTIAMLILYSYMHSAVIWHIQSFQIGYYLFLEFRKFIWTLVLVFGTRHFPTALELV